MNKKGFCFIFLINRIQVQLDGNEYGIDQHGATIPVNPLPPRGVFYVLETK